MASAAIVLAFVLFAALIWGCIRLAIWIIKTAVKEALREYEQEKGSRNGPQ